MQDDITIFYFGNGVGMTVKENLVSDEVEEISVSIDNKLVKNLTLAKRTATSMLCFVIMGLSPEMSERDIIILADNLINYRKYRKDTAKKIRYRSMIYNDIKIITAKRAE